MNVPQFGAARQTRSIEAKSHIDQVSVETAASGVDVAVLESLRGKDVLTGVVDVGTEEVETAETIASRIRVDAWPTRELMVTGVACDDGEFVVWTRDSGVPLLRAVTASCAVPTVSPPITIGSRRYMDGGMRSGTNADLARGYDRVVVLAPLGPSSGFGGALLEEVAELRSAGARVSSVRRLPCRAFLARGPREISRRRHSPTIASLAAARAASRQACSMSSNLVE